MQTTGPTPQTVSRGSVRLELTELLSRKVDLDPLVQSLVGMIVQAMEADRGTLYLVDAARGEVFSKLASGLGQNEIRLKLGQGVAGSVASTGQAARISS